MCWFRRIPNADVLLDHIVVVAQGKPDYRPAVFYHVPAPGDAVPDFKLRNQDGRPIHLGQFKGKALLVTFIYTRCPLPDFCPRVTRNFAVIEQAAGGQPGALCEDAPAVRQLRSGARYAGAAAGLWRHLYRQRREERVCALGFCRAGQAGAAGDGEVLRCGHYARGRTRRLRTRSRPR